MMLPARLAIPAGLFWYGWTAETRQHWSLPNNGVAIFSCGTVVTFQCRKVASRNLKTMETSNLIIVWIWTSSSRMAKGLLIIIFDRYPGSMLSGAESRDGETTERRIDCLRPPTQSWTGSVEAIRWDIRA